MKQGYKYSGIDWLGDIPLNWETKRLKDVITKIGSGVTPKGGSEVYVESGIPLLRSQNVYDDGLRIDDVSFIDVETNNKMKSSQLKPFDILINITGASIGRTCVVPPYLKKANINQHIIFLRIKKRNVNYLSFFIKSSHIKEYIMNIQAGTSKEALNMGQTLNIPILIPSLNEQTTISAYLENKTSVIDRKISLLEQKTTFYQQLRKTIIRESVFRGLNKKVIEVGR
jgi:type I restriction enzyme S subunit